MSNSGGSGPVGAGTSSIAYSGIASSSEAATVVIEQKISAEVVTGKGADNRLDRGIIYKGQFYPVDLPDSVEPGDQIEARILRSSEGIQVRFISAAGVATGNQQAGEFESELVKLITKLGLNSKIFSELQSFLKSADPVNITPGSGTLLSKAMVELEKLGLLSERRFFDADKIALTLKSFDAQTLKNALTTSKQNLFDGTPESTAQKQTVDDLKIALKTLIRELDRANLINSVVRERTVPVVKEFISGISKPVANDTTEIAQPSIGTASREVVKFEAALARMSLSTEGNNSSGSASRLIELLISLRENAAEPEGLNFDALGKLIKLQVLQLKDFEQTVKSILVSSSGENQMQILLKLLGNIDTEPAESDTPLQKEFKLLVKDLRQRIGDFLQEKINFAQLRDFLSQTLERLYEDFQLQPIERRLDSPTEVQREISQLKPDQLKALRIIEAQIRVILTSPGEASLSELGKWLMELQRSLESSSEEIGSAPQLKNLLDETLKQLEVAKKVNGGRVDSQLLGHLTELLAVIGQTDVPSRVLETRSHVSNIASLIKQIIALPAGGQEGAPGASGISGVLTNPAYKQLLTLLRKLDTYLPVVSGAQPAYSSELTEFAGDLLQTLERDAKASSLRLRETLKGALEDLTFKVSPASKNEDSAPLTSLSAAAHKSLESLVNTQDMLARINPAMQRAGEPIILLFPFFVNGMLSKLEVHYKNERIRKEEQRKQQKKKAPGNLSEQLEFEITLPQIGTVYVQLIVMNGAIFIRLSAEDEARSEKIKPYIDFLSDTLKRRGYRDIDISVVAGQRKKNWLSSYLTDRQ